MLNKEPTMAEQKTELRVFETRLICDECGEGEMLPTGVALMSSPPQYPHKCTKCGAQDNVRGKKYPHHSYEPVPSNARVQSEPPAQQE